MCLVVFFVYIFICFYVRLLQGCVQRAGEGTRPLLSFLHPFCHHLKFLNCFAKTDLYRQDKFSCVIPYCLL